MTKLVVDPIEFELFKNSILSVADEMALTIHRTTYSCVLKDNMDYSTAFFDGAGRLVAQGLTLPGHLGSMPSALAAIMKRFGDDVHPGDVFVLNDPFEGGMHLPDIFIFSPIFVDGELMAYGGTICHHTDVGGRVAGSNASDSTETYQEGLRIAPMRMYERGKRNETFFLFLEKNVRLPVRVNGDIRAQLAACHIAETAFTELCQRHGKAKVKFYMNELIEYAERMTRAAIARLPDGTFSFEDYIDDDGIDFGKPIPIKITIVKKGTHIRFDWTGSSPQVKGAINSTLSFSKSAVYCAMQSVMGAGIPNNEGVFRAIEVYSPPGTITNCVLPAACAARGLTGFRMVDVLFGALAQMLPDKVFACSDGGNTGISIGGYYADRSPFIYVDFTCSGWGGRPNSDGLDGNSNIYANMASQSVEITELEQPVLIEQYEFIADRGGPGKFRGGAPFRRSYRFLETEGVLQVRSDRRVFRPYGLYGGEPGRPSMNYFTANGDTTRPIDSKVTMTIRKGDLFSHEVAGAGGWGDPLDREAWRVLKDVRNEFVSLAAASRDYGVVIDPARFEVDVQATTALRARMRKARGWSSTPAVMHEPALPQAAE